VFQIQKRQMCYHPCGLRRIVIDDGPTIPGVFMRLVLRVLNGVAAGLFVFAAVVQYNDPDPLQWAAIYLSAAAASTLYLFGRLRWQIPVIIGLIALTWASVIAARIKGGIDFSRLFESWEMASPSVEQGRETIGLLTVAFWMAFLAVAVLIERRSRRKASARGSR
jgi:hypothetical protein